MHIPWLRSMLVVGLISGMVVSSIAIEITADPLPTLTFSAPFNSPPYKWIDHDNYIGIDADIVREACHRAGIPAIFQDRPWTRVLAEVKAGSADGGFAAFKTPDREDFAHFVIGSPIHYSTYVLFVKKGQEFPYKTIEDLFRKQIGISRGFSISKDFDTAVQEGKIEVQEITDLKQNIQKVLNGRIDAFVHNRDYTLYALKTQGFDSNVVMLPVPVQPARPAYLMISKAADIPHKEVVIERLNTALREMHEDGTIARIHENYLE